MPNIGLKKHMDVPHDITTERQNLDHVDDQALMHLVADGSQRAFAVLLTRHLSYAVKLALRYTQDISLAEDIAQDAFTKIWKKAHLWSDQHQVKFTTWFYRIVVNTAIDHQRKKKEITLAEMPDIADTQNQTEQDFAKQQQREHVLKAMDDLPERQKMALMLCFFQEHSNKEAAEMMDVSIKALETLLIRGKRQLRTVFDQRNERHET